MECAHLVPLRADLRHRVPAVRASRDRAMAEEGSEDGDVGADGGVCDRQGGVLVRYQRVVLHGG